MEKLTQGLNIPFGGVQSLNARIAKKFANCGEIGEGASIACDFLGKAAIVPLVVMTASKEPREKKEFSALKNPVAATIQLLMEVPILHIGSYLVGKAADNGFFDKPNSDFSYNEKACRKNFIDTFEKSGVKNSGDFIESVKTKGYTKEISEKFGEIAENADEIVKKELKDSFGKFESAHKNKFHLKNRICFVAALALTPVICGIENKIHPKIMDKIYKHRNKNKAMPLEADMDKFISNLKGGAA